MRMAPKFSHQCYFKWILTFRSENQLLITYITLDVSTDLIKITISSKKEKRTVTENTIFVMFVCLWHLQIQFERTLVCILKLVIQSLFPQLIMKELTDIPYNSTNKYNSYKYFFRPVPNFLNKNSNVLSCFNMVMNQSPQEGALTLVDQYPSVLCLSTVWVVEIWSLRCRLIWKNRNTTICQRQKRGRKLVSWKVIEYDYLLLKYLQTQGVISRR